MDVPIQLAVFILNLAKLRLLSFAYDEIAGLVDPFKDGHRQFVHGFEQAHTR